MGSTVSSLLPHPATKGFMISYTNVLREYCLLSTFATRK